MFGTLCAAIAAANLAGWLAQHARQSTAVVVAAAIAAATVAAVGLWVGSDRRDGGGVLVWDGARWTWAAQGGSPCLGEARVMLDLGSWLLLHFEPAADVPGRWLVATRRMAGPVWPAWRAALYAHRSDHDPVMP
jgi:hypothetical protein